MKKLTVKITAALLSAVLLAGCTFYFAKDKTNTTAPKTVSHTAANKQTPVNQNQKDETVYVLANADGSVKKVIVSNWIKNSLKLNKLSDKTEAENIENVKGDETYTVNGENAKVWDAEGNDIYYTGTLEKEIPVDLSVSYKLDGKPVSAEELAGKSGRVTVRYDYKNKQYETVTVDGKSEKMYVPFVMLTGLLLDNETFSNVTVSNGKAINDGKRTAVIGFALPQLNENLKLDREILDIPDYVEISADAKEFTLGMTLTVATSEIFSNIDTEKLDKLDGITEQIGQLGDSMNKLVDGSSALYSGLDTLLQSSDTLINGIDALAVGTKKLNGGADELLGGAEQLYTGLDTLNQNSKSLNEGAKAVFNSSLKTATDQLIAAGALPPGSSLTIENYADTLNYIISQVGAESPTGQMLMSVKAGLDSLNTFYTGVLAYTDGVGKTVGGAKQLSDGAKELSGGIKELLGGILTVKDGIPKLKGGVGELKNGAMQLSEGLKQFKTEGIDKITKIVNTDIKGIATRLRATVDVAKNYKTFSGCGDNTDSTVKFIYKTDEIK